MSTESITAIFCMIGSEANHSAMCVRDWLMAIGHVLIVNTAMSMVYTAIPFHVPKVCFNKKLKQTNNIRIAMTVTIISISLC